MVFNVLPTYGNDQVPQWSEDATLSASEVTQTGATLTWTPAADDTGVTDYRIYDVNNNSVAATVSGAVYECSIDSLDAGTDYTFKVEAGNAAGNWSANGPSIQLTTLAVPDQTPQELPEYGNDQVPQWPEDATLSASDVTQTGATLTWTPATDDAGVTDYKVYNTEDNSVAATVSGAVYECSINSLDADTDYTFKVEAGDADGNWSTNGPSTQLTTLAAADPTSQVLPLGVPAVVDTVNPMIFEGGIVADLSQSEVTPGATLTVTEVQQDPIPGLNIGKVVKLQFSYGFRGNVLLSLPLKEGMDPAKSSIYWAVPPPNWRTQKAAEGYPKLVDGVNGGKALQSNAWNYRDGIGHFALFEDTHASTYTLDLTSILSNEVKFRINAPRVDGVQTVDPSGISSFDIYRDGVLLLNLPNPNSSATQGHYDKYYSYSDKTVQPGNTYRYSMKTRDWYDNVSDFSPEVTVTVADDAGTVAAIKAMELVSFAEGDGVDSVTQNLEIKSAPYGAATVTFESSNTDVLSPLKANTFTVTKPDADSVAVKLTETITCGTVTDTKEYNLTVRWTETAPVSSLTEFRYALNRELVKTIVLKKYVDVSVDLGIIDCHNKKIVPDFSGIYMLSFSTARLDMGNLIVDGNNVSTVQRVVNLANSRSLNFENVIFQNTEGFQYIIYASENDTTGAYDIVASNCSFSPVKNYVLFATTSAVNKGKPGYGKKLTLTGNTFASGANIKIEAGIATLANNIINSKIEAMIGATLNGVVITDQESAQQAVDALLASNQITAPVDGSYGITIYDTSGTTVLYQALKVEQPVPALVGASTDTTGSKVTVEFNMTMADPSSQKDQFTVLVNGNADPATAAVLNTDDSKKIDLALTTPVVYGDRVKISYTPGTVASAGGGLLESFTGIDVANNVSQPVVETPSANPGAGEVDKNTTVALTTATAGASIYYTLDGTPPTGSSSLYENPIIIDEAKTIKAIAVKDGMQDSSVLTAAYTVKADTRVTAYICEINGDNTSTQGAVISSNSAVPVDPVIKLKFSNNVVYNAAQNISCISLRDNSGQVVPDVDIFALGNADNTNPEKNNIFIRPGSPLALSTVYKIAISPEVTFKNGAKLGDPAIEIKFTIVDELPGITFTKATLSGSNLTLAGLPSGANLEYRIVTGGDSSAWTVLSYAGTTATVDASALSLVSGVSQVEVRAMGGSGTVVSQTVFIAVDGNKVEMENGAALCFDDNVTVYPDGLDSTGNNQTGIKRTTLPAEMRYKIFPVGYAYEVYLQGSGDAKNATLSFPVDPALNIDQVSVYVVDKSGDATADKSNPSAWVIQYLVPDRSQADKHIISVAAADVPETGGSFIYQVFYDNWLPGPATFTGGAIVDIQNKTITFPQIQAHDTDALSKIEIYRDGNMIGLIDLADSSGGTYHYTDADPALQVGQTYAYNLKAYDRMGNWTWHTNVGVGAGEPMKPAGDLMVLFEDDASVVEKVKQQLLDGTLPITFAPGDSFDHVVTDFQLPNTYSSWPGVGITWSSSDPEVIRTLPGYNVIVVKPADGLDREVTLTATINRQGGTATASWKINVSWEPWEGGVMPVRMKDGHNGVRDTAYEFWTALNKDNIQKIVMLTPFEESLPDNTLDLKGKTLVFQDCYLNSGVYKDGVNAIIKNGVIDATGASYDAMAIAHGGSGFRFENVEFKGGEALDSYVLVNGGSLWLTNCRFGPTKVAPVSIQQSNNSYSPGIRIESCTFDGAGKPGYAVSYNTNGELLAINNIITGFQGNTSSGPSAGFLIPYGRTATLEGNKISNCDNGILVQTRTSANSKVNDVLINNQDAAERAGIALLESNELTPGSGPVVLVKNYDSLFNPVVWYQADKDELTGLTAAPTWVDGGLTASEIDESELTLSWSGAGDPVAVTGYRVYQGANLVAEVPGTDTSCRVTRLLPGIIYQFKVEAGNAQGKWSLDGPSVDVTTTENTAPVWPEGSQVSVTEVGPTSVILNWNPATDEQGVRLYKVYYDGKWTVYWTKANNPSNAVVYIDQKHLQPNTEYTFQIYAQDTLGAESPGPSITVKTTSGEPTNWALGSDWLAVTNLQSDSMTLNWKMPTIIGPPTTNAQIRILRNGEQVATVSSGDVRYTVTGLLENHDYTFKLEIVDNASTYGPSITVRTPAQGTMNGQIGSPLDIYLNGSDKWLNAISDVQIGGDYDRDGISVFDKCTVSPGHIQIGAGAFTEDKDYDLLIRSTGYPDVYVTQTISKNSAGDPANPPVLQADTSGNLVGNLVDITFIDDAAWRNAISDVTIDGGSISGQYSVSAGKITIDAGVFDEAKDYVIIVKATGYADASITQTINSAPAPVPAPKLLSGEITSKGDLSLTFDKEMADPAGTQGQFTVTVDGAAVAVSGVETTNTVEKIKLVLSTKATGANNVTISYTKSADPAKQLKSVDGGLVESFSTQIGEALTNPPTLKKDASDNHVGNPVDITFIDEAAWRNAISDVTIDGSSISGQYSVSAGKITIGAGLFTEARDYEIVVKATGYSDTGVTQKMHKVITGSSVTVDEGNKNLAVAGTTPATTVTIPEGINNATINVGGLLNAPAGGEVQTGALPALTITADTSIDAAPVQVEIPAGTTVSAPEGWDGTINVPTVRANDSVTVTPDADKTATVKAVIEVGFGDVPLTFSQAVKLVIPGQAGKDVGYFRNGTFTPITNVCATNSQAWADANLPAGEDGKVDDGQDLVIWTKHFTLFAAYEQSAAGNDGGGGGGDGSGSGTSGGLNVSFNKAKLSPTDTLLQFDFDSGIDRTLNSNLSKIKVYEKNTGSEVQYSDYNYIKQGQGDDAVKIRRLELMFDNLKSGTIYVVELAADFEANNGGTLGAIQSFEFTTTGTASAAGGAGPSAEQEIGTDGGTINEYGAMILIPAASFNQSIKVAVQKITDVSDLPMAAKSILASDVIEITKDQDGNFDKAVTITLTFDKSKVDTNKYDLIICYLNEEENRWIALDNIKVDLAAATVSGEIKHFTKLAIIAVEKAQASLPLSPGELVNLSDIQEHWAQPAIAELISLGAIGGYPDGTFKPDQGISRAEFASILVKALQLEQKQGKVFNDTAGHWAQDAIATAAAYGIVNGYSDTSFGPDDSITREQMAVMVVKAAKLAEVKEGKAFADGNKISAWAGNAVATASQNQIINGYPDNTFRPQNNASRAEAATVIVKALQLAA